MPVPLVLMAAGTALQVYGNLKANYDQAQAELQNAKFYEEQAQFSLDAQFRAESITARNYESRKGAQISAYAKGNVDLSGSAAVTIAETVAEKAEELSAIQKKGAMDFKLARARSRMAEAHARELQDPMNNLMQAGGTALTNAASYKAAGGNFDMGGGSTSGGSSPGWSGSSYYNHIKGDWDRMA
jgi:hypothetical protein